MPSLRTDAVLQGTLVPAGEHELEFVYAPAFMRQGGMAALAGLALLGVMVWPASPRRWLLDFQA